MQLAYHYAVDFYNVANTSIADKDYLLTAMKAATELVKSSILITNFIANDDASQLYLNIQLTTGFFNMHIRPNDKFCSFDYYDSEKPNIKYAIDYLTNLLNPKTIRLLEIKRGSELTAL